ncbi:MULTISPECIES: hypothetical protein [unclassified Nocardioides]|uniref:hypothetical protein n=1 Tax=unclassified Nocardioides TaxID=2615069 RepID=UPI003014DD3F
MSPAAGARTRTATTLVALAALLLGTLVAVLGTHTPADAADPPAPGGSERRYAPGIDPTLPADATVRGTVLGPDGQLRDYVLVEAFSVLDPGGEPVASDLTYEVGDLASHGAYTLHVPAGDYLVRFSSPDGVAPALEPAYYGNGAGTTVTVAPAQDLLLDPVALERDRGVPVTGRVLDQDGRPMGGIRVSLVRPVSDLEYSVRSQVWTDDDGAFTFPVVDRGRTFTISVYGAYDIDETRLGLPTTWLGGAPSIIDAETFTLGSRSPGRSVGDLVLRPGTPVTGTITLRDTYAQGVDVALVHLNAEGDRGWVVAWAWLPNGVRRYRFSALPGRYTLAAIPADGPDEGETFFLGDTTDLGEAQSFLVGDQAYDAGSIPVGPGATQVTFQLFDRDGGPADGDQLWAGLVDRDGTVLSRATGLGGGRYQAKVRWNTEFTVYVYDQVRKERRYLGGGTVRREARFLSASPESATLDVGVISFQLPAPTAATPTVRGTARAGQRLAVDVPTWSTSEVRSAFQWRRDDVPIDGAVDASYQLTSADVGHVVSVRITGSASGRAPGVVTSPGLLVGAGEAPTATTPAPTGTARNGHVLTAPSPDWSLPEVSSTYQWLRDGQPIRGATSDSYLLRTPDVGHRISVRITGHRPGHETGTVTSAAVPVGLGDPPPVLQRGFIRGSSDPDGGIVRLSPTIWPADVTSTLQWYADGRRVPGATSTTLRLSPRLARTTLTVVSTATRVGSVSATSTSYSFRVGFAAPRIRLTARGSKVTLRVSAPGGLPTTGRVVIHHDRRIVARTMLTARQHGVTTIDLARLGRGRHTVRVSYGGNDLVGGTGGRPLKVDIE